MAINLVIFSGNIGADMELRYTQNSKAIGTFPLPVKQGFGDNEKTSWVKVKTFGNRAEALQKKLKKGLQVTVHGEYVEEKWEGADGTKHSQAVIIMNDIVYDAGAAPKQDGSPQQQGAQFAGQARPAPPPIDDLPDGDLPF